MKTLHIDGRRWFRKNVGATYHSVTIIVDGHLVHRIDYAYGYDSQYRDNAVSWLAVNGYLPGIEKSDGRPYEPLFRYCGRNGIVLTDTVIDVQRRKDL